MNKENIMLNISHNDNDFIYTWDKFGDKPNKISIFNNYSIDINEYLLNKSISTNSTIDIIDFDMVNEKKFLKINDNVYASYTIIDKNSDTSFVNNITLFYKSTLELECVNAIIEDILEYTLESESSEASKLNTVFLTEDGGLELEAIEKIELNENVDAFYNKETVKSINRLTKTLKKSEKGITIFYGVRGTGKTSIINSICDKLNKTFIYIPNTLVESSFGNSDFTEFLRKNNNSIIVLDDCETNLNDIYSKSSSNIIQLLDGILSHSVKLNIITIFNVDDEEDICETLKDSNSLIELVKFELLTEDECNNLSKTLNLNKNYKNKNRMIDVLKNNNNIVYKKIGL